MDPMFETTTCFYNTVPYVLISEPGFTKTVTYINYSATNRGRPAMIKLKYAVPTYLSRIPKRWTPHP